MRVYVGTGKYPFDNKGDTWTETAPGIYTNPKQPGKVVTHDQMTQDVKNGYCELWGDLSTENKKPKYEWVEFVMYDEAPGQTIEERLQKLLCCCDFVCTKFGEMWPTEGIRVGMGHRGPTLEFPDGEFVWFYRVTGGYRRIDK